MRARTGNNQFETENLEGNENKRVGSYLKGGRIKEKKTSKLLFSGKREWEAYLGVMTEVGTGQKGGMEVGKIQELGDEHNYNGTDKRRERTFLYPMSMSLNKD